MLTNILVIIATVILFAVTAHSFIHWTPTTLDMMHPAARGVWFTLIVVLVSAYIARETDDD
jgi:Kef-type K+ transport system membrane component KefB